MNSMSRFTITTDDLIEMSQFNEADHPRGQPENAGEFASKEGAKKKRPSAPFSEERRLTNLNPKGASWERIARDNPGVNPNSRTVTIYRATIGNSIRDGEYVALNKQISQDHLESLKERGESGIMLSQQVDIDDLLMANDSTEFIYYPKNDPSDTASKNNVTNSPQFKSWFGKSSIVNPDGSPKVVYHGTASEFNEFLKPKATDKEGRKLGMGWGKGKFYFADSGEAASSAASFAEATKRGSQQNVMPVYIRIEKPISADDYMARIAVKQHLGKSRDQAIAATDKELQKQGYDGIVDENSGGMAVFDPRQIKSAMTNNGNFDPGNSRIDMSHRFSITAADLDQFSHSGEHEFSSTQFNIEDGGYSRSQGSPLGLIRLMASKIKDEDLGEDGREDEFHVTIKYGIHADTDRNLRRVVADFGSVEITLGRTAMFEAKEPDGQDVVYIEVFSDELRRLNRLICENTKCTDTHPTYIPHVCLAYVKPGKGKDYIGDDTVEGQKLFFTEFQFSGKDRQKTEVSLVDGIKLKVNDTKTDLAAGNVQYATFDDLRSMTNRASVSAIHNDWISRFSITSEDLQMSHDVSNEKRDSSGKWTNGTSHAEESVKNMIRPHVTETPQFKKWFGSSKIVDDSGKPLVVYHGNGRDFDQFSPKTIGQGDPGFHGEGFYFSEDPQVASDYAPSREMGNVKPVYLSIKKPFMAPTRHTHGEDKWRDAYRSELEKIGVTDIDDKKQVTERLKSAGYDGVVVRVKNSSGNLVAREIVAFEPTQIKSSLGNRGTFDPSDPRINMSHCSITADDLDLFDMGQLTFNFDESKHPRGHEGNPGQFVKKGEGKSEPVKTPVAKPTPVAEKPKSTLTSKQTTLIDQIGEILANRHPARGRMTPTQLLQNTLENVPTEDIRELANHPEIDSKSKLALVDEIWRRSEARKSTLVEEERKRKEAEQKAIEAKTPKSPRKTISEITGHKATREHVDATLNHITKLHSVLPSTKAIPVKTTSGKQTVGQFHYYPVSGEPLSISVSSNSPHPRLTFAHEFGHFLDLELGKHIAGRGVAFASTASRSDRNPGHPAEKLLDAIHKSKATSEILGHIRGPGTVKRKVQHPKLGEVEVSCLVNKSWLRYLLRPDEQFARAYSQYVAIRSGDEAMKAELAASRKQEVSEQWADDDFEPIAKAFDEYFATVGLKKGE